MRSPAFYGLAAAP